MRSLLKELSTSELMHMRENGMTNSDIANAVGVSVTTIYRHIGAQPPGMRKQREYRTPIFDAPRATVDPPVEEEAALVVEDRSIGLAGLFAGYKVHIKSKEVAVFVEDGADALVIPFDQVKTFAKELAAISRHIDSLAIGNEMW